MGIRIKIKGTRQQEDMKRSVRMESTKNKKVANICPMIPIKQKRF